MKKFIVERIMKARWIVNTDGELGIRICGINMWYYKWPEPMVAETGCDGGSWRYADKREFGEVIHSQRN